MNSINMARLNLPLYIFTTSPEIRFNCVYIRHSQGLPFEATVKIDCINQVIIFLSSTRWPHSVICGRRIDANLRFNNKFYPVAIW